MVTWYYAEACNEWWGLSPRLSAWARQKRRSGGEALTTMYDLAGPVIEPQISRADSSGVPNHSINRQHVVPSDCCVIEKSLVVNIFVIVDVFRCN